MKYVGIAWSLNLALIWHAFFGQWLKLWNFLDNSFWFHAHISALAVGIAIFQTHKEYSILLDKDETFIKEHGKEFEIVNKRRYPFGIWSNLMRYKDAMWYQWAFWAFFAFTALPLSWGFGDDFS